METSASELQKYAEKSSHEHNSSSYPPGTYYAICVVQSQLLQALLALMNESLTEGIKGFYNLRKAYILLDSIIAHEQKMAASNATISGEESIDKSTYSLPLNETTKSRFLTKELRTSSSENDFQRLSISYKNLDSRNKNQSDEVDSDEEDFFDADEFVDDDNDGTERSKVKGKANGSELCQCLEYEVPDVDCIRLCPAAGIYAATEANKETKLKLH